MKKLIIFLVLFSIKSWASIVGISTHPLNEKSRVLSAEMTGYMSRQNEMGMGLRYTQSVSDYKVLDFNISGAQESRAMNMNLGMDFIVLNEDVSRPRLSFKSFLGFSKIDNEKNNLIGFAPTMRKGLSIGKQEIFPYLSIPAGMKINTNTDEFVFTTSLAMGASFNYPGLKSKNLLMSVEANKDLGYSSDYLACLVSWVWN